MRGFLRTTSMVAGLACLAVGLYQWARAADHPAPGVPAWKVLDRSGPQSDPETYAPEVRWRIRLARRLTWAGVALLTASFVLGFGE